MARTQIAAGGGGGALVSRDGRAAVVLGFLRPGADGEAATEAVEERLGDEPGVSLGGGEPTGEAVGSQVSEDLGRAEAIAFPVLLALSLWVFRGFVAALLPLFVGVLTIFGTFFGLRLVNAATELSIYALRACQRN